MEIDFGLKKNVRHRLVFWVLLIYTLISYCVWFLNDEVFWWVTTEDGLMENLSAIYFLLCALLCFYLFFRGNCDAGRNYWYLLLALLFVVFCGEEISWGQRLFDIETPEPWKQLNVQQELNLHNLVYVNPYDFDNQKKPFIQQLFTMNAIYAYFVFGFCFITPLLRRSQFWQSLSLDKLRLPSVPLLIGCFFVLTYVIDKTVKLFLTDIALRYPNEEIREHLWSFYFFTICLLWFLEKRRLE